MKPFNLSVAVISLIVILLGLFYKRLNRSVFNETLLAMLAGILLGPFALGVLNIGDWGAQEDLMEHTSRLTLAMALMATALRIPNGYLFRFKKVQVILLLLVMPLMFLASASILHFFALLSWLPGLLIGAIITPTDPVLASTIINSDVAQKGLPAKLKDTISFESGANDGLAYPLVMLCMLLIGKSEGMWMNWITRTVLWETGGAVLLGAILGYVFGQVLKFCIKKNMTAKPAVLAFALAVSLFVLTALELIRMNGILAVFVTGLMLKRVLTKEENLQEENIQEMMARLFTLPVFVFFGLILPWKQWLDLGWTAITVVALILLLRRLPILLMVTPLFKVFRLRDAAFIGWFGPVGVAALYYCFHAYKTLHWEELWIYTSLIVFSSVVIHGMTGYLFLKLYQKRNRNKATEDQLV